jgi:hypothetical protein
MAGTGAARDPSPGGSGLSTTRYARIRARAGHNETR